MNIVNPPLMKRKTPCYFRLLGLTVAISSFCGTVLAAEKPEDIYREAYLTPQVAVSPERTRDLQAAADRLADAHHQFTSLRSDWPEWDPQLLRRLDKVLESLAALTDKPAGALQAPEKPDDVYLEAYITMRDAVDLERAGDLQEAAGQFALAQQLFARVQSEWPEWNPAMVKYRLEKLAESIADLNAKLDSE